MRKPGLAIDHQLMVRDLELAWKERKHAHLSMMLVQESLRKNTSVIGLLEVEGKVVGRSSAFRSACPQGFFFLLNFSPSLQKKKSVTRKKGKGGRSSYTNFQQVDG
jgi:hypothetical protein